MKATRTSGPMAKSSTHHARDETSSRHSLPINAAIARLGKGKKDLFQIGRVCPAGGGRCRRCRELVDRAFAAHGAAAQQHESIAHPRRVVNLMDREKERPARRRVCAKRCGHVTALAQIETVERL